MREILFRGKEPLPKNLPNVKIWAYGQLVQRDDYCCIFESEDVVHPSDYPYLNSEIGWIDGCLTPVIPETVGQFTGLLDKNGRKIFEGDILEETLGPYSTREPERYLIDFNEGCFTSIQLCNPHACHIPLGDNDFGILYDYMTVVGNIHDNPELLTKS